MNKKVLFSLFTIVLSTFFGTMLGMQRTEQKDLELKKALNAARQKKCVPINASLFPGKEVYIAQYAALMAKISRTQIGRKEREEIKRLKAILLAPETKSTTQPKPTPKAPTKKGRPAVSATSTAPTKGRGRGGVKKTATRPVASRTQRTTSARDPFIAKLGDAVKGYETLQDGSYVVQVKSADQGDDAIPKELRGPTCALFALRNSQLMLNYIATEYISYINRLVEVSDAVNFLREVKLNRKRIHDLSGEDIENLLAGGTLSFLERYASVYVAVNKQNTFVIEETKHVARAFLRAHSTIESIDEGIAKALGARPKADIKRIKAQVTASKLSELENLPRLQAPFQEKIAEIKGAIARLGNGGALAFIYNTGGHWISISVTKKADKLYWFVVNSCKGNCIDTAKKIAQQVMS